MSEDLRALFDKAEPLLAAPTHKTYGVARKEVGEKTEDLRSMFDKAEPLAPSSFSWDTPAAPKPERSGIATGFEQQYLGTKGGVYGLAGAVGRSAGIEGLQRWGEEGAAEVQARQQEIATPSSSFMDVWEGKEGAEWGSWAAQMTGGAAEIMAEGLAMAGVGAVVGSVVPGIGNVAGGATGFVTGTVMSAARKLGFQKMIAKAVAAESTKVAAAAASKGVTLAANEVADIATQNVVRSTVQAGAFIAASAAKGTGVEVGTVYNDAVEIAEKTGKPIDMGRVYTYGIAAGLLDSVAEVAGVGRLFRVGKGTGRMSNAARGAAAQFITEGGTEGVQSVLERIGSGKYDSFTQMISDPAGRREIIDSIAAGAVMGGGIGMVGGAAQRPAAQTDVGGLPEADISATPGQNVPPPAEPYDQQVERAYGVKLGLPTEQQFSAQQQAQAERDLNAGLNPSPAQPFDPASYWEGFAPTAAAPDAAADPTQVSLDRAAKAQPVAEAIKDLVSAAQEAVDSIGARPGIYDTISQAGRALDDAANFRSARGEQAFMRRADRNLGEPIPPPAEAPLPKGVATDPAAREAAIARMTRGLDAPVQGEMPFTVPEQPKGVNTAPPPPAAPAPGVAQVAQPAPVAPAPAPVAAPAPTEAPVGTTVASPAPAAPQTEAPQIAPAAPLGTQDDAITVPGTAYDGEPAQIAFLTDGTKLTDARIKFADGTEVGIALKKGDTFESVVARAEADGDFTREEGFNVGQVKAQPKAKKVEEQPNRFFTTRGESVDLQKREEQEAAVAKLKADMKKARKKGRAKRELPDDATTADRQEWVNQKLAGDTGMKKSITLVETPARWKLMTQVIEALFDQKVQFWSPVNAEINRLYEGFALAGDPDTIYVSVNVQNPFAFVMGHEFGHNISRLNPQLWSRFMEELKPLIDKKEMQAFVHRLRAQYDRQAKNGGRRMALAEIGAIAEDEAAADALGTAFMDPKFWKALHDAADPKAQPLIVRMIAEVKAFIEDVMAMLKAAPTTRNSKMFTDTRALHRVVSEMLLDFGGLRETLPYKELLKQSEQFYTEKMEPASNEADWVELDKDLQEQFAELYDMYRQGDISWSELESDYLRIQKVWRSNSVTDELKQRLTKKYDEDQRKAARKYWDETLHEPGEPKFDALTPEWQDYFVKQFRAYSDNQNVSLADAYDKALDGLNIVRDEKKAEIQRQKKAAKSVAEQQKRVAAEVAAAEAEQAKRAAANKAAAEKKAAAQAEAIAKAQEKKLEKMAPKAVEALQSLTPAEKKRVSSFYKAKSWTEDVAKAFTREVSKLMLAGDDEALIDAVPAKLRPVIWRILRTISHSLKSTNPLDNPRFARWFGNSQIVVKLTAAEREQLAEWEKTGDELVGWERRDYEKLKEKAAREGQPEVWYHGTSRDILVFQGKQANSIFVTKSLRFAEDFANTSDAWAVSHGIKKHGAAIYPLYVKAEKIFDYENEGDVEAVIDGLIEDLTPFIEKEAVMFGEDPNALMRKKINSYRRDFAIGEWSTIESLEVQRVIRRLGFDSYHMFESGFKNLAVYNSSQLKSVYGNRGTYNDVGDIRYSMKEVGEKDLVGLTDKEIAFWKNKDGSLRDVAARFVEKLGVLTASVEEVAAVAWAGRAKRGWYMDSVKALQQVFGQDAPRFAALLAAMSPQTSVESNLENALAVWAAWVKAGRPTDKESIVKIMGRSVQQADLQSKPKYAIDRIAKHFGLPVYLPKSELVTALEAIYKKSTKNRDIIRQMSVLPAWENNSVRALSAEDPAETVLSGPKVDSFYRNLTGDLNEVTNDAWMAAFFAIDKTLLGGELTKGGNPGKGPRYLALSSRVRQAAALLSELTGDVWTPAEVQETIWAWSKTLYELQEVKGETRNAVQLLNDGALTDELIAATPDFRSLFYDDAKPYKRLLADAGLADKLGDRNGFPAVPTRRRAGAKRGAQGEAASPLGVGQKQYEQAAAQRLADRAAGEPPLTRFSLKDESPRGVNVEVAPNPDDRAVAEAFDALPERSKIDATYEVAESIIPQVLEEMGVAGEVEYTLGGFEGASNPSLILKLPSDVPFDTMVEVGKVVGNIFQQKAIIAYDEADRGGTQTGFVKVTPSRGLSYDEQKDLFARIYKLMPEAAGFTSREGDMVFGNFTDLSDAAFHDKLDAAVSQVEFNAEFTTNSTRFRSEWVEPVTLEGTRYGKGNAQGDAARGDVPLGTGRIDSLRQQAQDILARYAQGEGVSPAVEAGNADRVAFSRKDAAPVIEVYGLEGGKVAGLASFDPLTKVWSVWNAPAGQDIRDVQITPVQVAKTEDALNALRRPGVRLVRRRSSPYNDGGNTPNDFGVEVDNEPGGDGNAFTRAVDALVTAANKVFATNLDGPTLRQGFIRMVQDAYIDVKVVQNNIRKKGGRITGANNLYQAITLYPGRTGAQMQAFEKEYAEPMEEAIEAALKKGASVESIEEWLMARHAGERNAIIRQRTGGQNDAGSGMTDAEAQTILAQRPAWQQELDAIGKIADSISVFKLNLMLQSGLIDQQTHDALSNYKHYVPLKGLDEDDTGEITANFGVGTGTGFSGKGSLLKYATGRGSRANHIISHLLLDAEAKIVRAGKNDVAKTLLKMAEDFPDPTFWKVNEVKVRPSYDPNSGSIRMQSDPDFLNPNIVVAYVNGVGSKVEVSDADFARALTNAAAAGTSPVLEFMRRMNGWWSQMVTTYNPVWTIVNGLRDAQTAYFNIKADPKLPPDMGRKVLANIAAMNPRSGIWELMREPGAQNEWARLYRELEQAGGITHFFGVRTLEDRARKMVEMENRVAKRGLPAKVQDAWRKARGPEFAKLLQDMGATIEAVPRVAAYKALIEAGWSKADAADYAKNLTVNFNRKGTQKFLSSAYMFFNPAVQGTARLWTALQTDEGKAIAGGLLTLGFLAGLTGNSAGDDDENGIPDYQQMSSWERSTNFIPWPNGPKIPLPYGWNFFYAAGNYLSDLFHGRGLGHVLWNQVKAAGDAFDPIGSADSKSVANWLVKGVSPTAVDPLVQFALNDNAFGSSILPQGASRTFRPDSESGKQSVGWVWREGARAVNRMTGGSASQAGAIDINPNTLEHFWAGYLPGWPQDLAKTVSTTAKFVRGEDMEAREVPVVRKVWAQPQKTSYDDLAQAKEKLAELAAMSKGDGDDRKELGAKYPGWMGLKVTFDLEQKKVTDFYKRKAKITDGKLKVGDPAAEQKRLDDEIAKANNRMLKAYRERSAKWAE